MSTITVKRISFFVICIIVVALIALNFYIVNNPSTNKKANSILVLKTITTLKGVEA